jgi:hypothetical protein
MSLKPSADIANTRGLALIRAHAVQHRETATKVAATAGNLERLARELPALPYISCAPGKYYRIGIEVNTRKEALAAYQSFQELLPLSMTANGMIEPADPYGTPPREPHPHMHPVFWRHTPGATMNERRVLIWCPVVASIKLVVRCFIIADPAAVVANHTEGQHGHIVAYNWRQKNYPKGAHIITPVASATDPPGATVWFPNSDESLDLKTAFGV